MPRLSLKLFNTFEISRDGQMVTGFVSTKVRGLLGYLAVEAAQPHLREELAVLLWPERSHGSARTNLRQALANLRSVLDDEEAEKPLLLITRDYVQFNRAGDYWIDVGRFSELLDSCDSHVHRRATICMSCEQRLTQALALYRGPFLDHFFAGDSDSYDEWSGIVRERLHLRATAGLAQLISYYEQYSAYPKVCNVARRLIELDPWREEAHRALMQALWLSGERATALNQYERCRQALLAELAIEPDAETVALYERIRTCASKAEPQHSLPRQRQS